MVALQAPARCPRCERPLALHAADVEGRRARCRHCRTGCDLLSLRSRDEGPMRTFERLHIVPDDVPPPAYMEDRSGGGRTRHVRLRVIRPAAGEARLAFSVAVLDLSLTVTALVGFTAGLGSAALILAMGTFVAWLMFRRESMAAYGTEDIWIRRGRLYRRRSAIGMGWTRSVPLAQVSDVEVSPGIGTGPFVEVRLVGGRRMWLAEDFAQGEAALVWLRDHLRAGIATARDDRGRAG